MKTILSLSLMVLVAWKATDTLSDLNLTQTQVEKVTMYGAKTGFTLPSWSEYSLYNFVKKAKSLPAGSQAAAVKSLGAIVKTYVQSEQFKGEWQAYLKEKGFYDPKAAGDVARLEEMKKQSAKQKGDMAASTKKMNESQQQMAKILKEHPEMMDMMKNQMSKEDWAEMQEYLKNPQKATAAAQGNTSSGDDYIKKEEARIQKAQEDYENNKYTNMVRLRLKSVIETANSVDFAAEVKANKYNQKKFVNPVYEKKSDLWKLFYRAGKEPTMAARDFAQQWLGELK
ncbi:hypothetical protein QNI19_36730 [Cytophagaceae bacterium DM2B3-1]|uniref:DUF3826 domain-containing protein n=1 Tax=Xanthocytophaga flava TaxID=3048013 RepID=A0ABT7CXP3_9BACT|nr:hypothetical protein [Xanthocytophaga flavus]MDJ1498540.1 hypothetical protein [Xanthocytophaga flavus]